MRRSDVKSHKPEGEKEKTKRLYMMAKSHQFPQLKTNLIIFRAPEVRNCCYEYLPRCLAERKNNKRYEEENNQVNRRNRVCHQNRKEKSAESPGNDEMIDKNAKDDREKLYVNVLVCYT